MMTALDFLVFFVNCATCISYVFYVFLLAVFLMFLLNFLFCCNGTINNYLMKYFFNLHVLTTHITRAVTPHRNNKQLRSEAPCTIATVIKSTARYVLS